LRPAGPLVILRASALELAMSAGVRRKEKHPDGRTGNDGPNDRSWPRPPHGLELSFVWIDGEELAVLSHPLDEPVPLDGLTEAERHVTADVVDGLSNAQIARRRGTAKGTVAKQVASIFRKLGVGSRRELVAMTKGGVSGVRAPRH
jgi:DNA-binding CsgD family transcriptional regulator